MAKDLWQNMVENIPAAAYVAMVYLFIYLPVGVLVLFSF